MSDFDGITVRPPASRLQEAESLLERALYLPSMERDDIDMTVAAIKAFFDAPSGAEPPGLRTLLDECAAGPWTPEGGIDYDEDKQVVWLTNKGQDSLRLDAVDVALLLNAALSGSVPQSEREGLDVDRLAEAWANVMDGRRIHGVRISADTTTSDDWREIAAEYARLASPAHPDEEPQD